jgi:3-dehydroquinate dehydratase
VPTIGLDPDARVENKLCLKKKSLFDIDEEKADVVLCLEVAEHIDNSQSDDVVKIVSNSTEKYLIWTAAQPGQGGEGHINCQLREYWLEKFLAIGMKHDVDLENKLRAYIQSDTHLGWFPQNLILLKK